MADRLFAGVDVGGTHVRIGLVSEGGELVRESIMSTESLSDGERTAAGILDAFDRFLGGDSDRLAALCMGFPSVVSKDRRVLLHTPNVPGLNRIPMADLAESRFPFPVFIEKDVNLLLRYDIEVFRLADSDPVLGFYIGTGLGNALWIGGRFFTGATGASGELGHTPMRGNGAVCSCGNTGCVEMIASGKALAAHVAHDHPECPIGEYFLRHGDSAYAKELLELLAMPIATEMNILDPAAAVLGGGVVHMAGFPRIALISEIHKRLRSPYPRESVKLLFSEENRHAGVLGAAAYARDALAR